jgi:hypothetical protein
MNRHVPAIRKNSRAEQAFLNTAEVRAGLPQPKRLDNLANRLKDSVAASYGGFRPEENQSAAGA